MSPESSDSNSSLTMHTPKAEVLELIAAELDKRQPQGAESRRIFHGRGHCFPGAEHILIDWYLPVVVITVYRFCTEDFLLALVNVLKRHLTDLKTVVLQERYRTEMPSRLLWGWMPDQVDAVEDGLRFRLRLGQAQNVGFFLDMKPGRQLVRERCAGKKILNLFAYSCSFSIAALAGGANAVVNVDMNRGALKLGRLNHHLNGLDLRSCSFLPLELFRSIGKIRKLGPFDFIIADPPAAQGRSFTAQRDWPKLLRKIPMVLRPGGEFLVCLNGPDKCIADFKQMVSELIPESGLLKAVRQNDDFPEREPEKGLWLLLYRVG